MSAEARSVYDRYVCLPTSDEECQNEILVFRVYINSQKTFLVLKKDTK